MNTKCEKIQELLITDHADGELGEEMRLVVDEHLGSCASCRKFASAVSVNTRDVFAAAVKREPPSYILERVKAAIASGKSERFGLREHLDAIGSRFADAINSLPRPAVAFAATVMIIIAVFIAHPIVRARAINEYLSEQITYMADLDGEEANGAVIFDTDITTGAERLL